MNTYNTPCCKQNTHSACSMNSHESVHPCTKSRFPLNTAYAMAYVPFQQSGEVYSCERALSRGTIFPCLDLPFLKGCCK